MKKIILLVSLVFFSGCLVRTYTVEKPRVDMQIEGNQGYLSGSSKPGEGKKSTRLGDTRKVSIVEVEFGPKKGTQEIVTDNENSGTSMSVLDQEISRGEAVPQKVVKPTVKKESVDYEYYTVQKNDTLQKISQKFYGTTRKWQMLYEFNKASLKTPDKIYPGKKIKIPVER